MHPALFSRPLDRRRVECRLCALRCRLDPGQTGPCRVRHNRDGRLLTSAWGRPVAMAVEPIEKKYLFHVLPGSLTLSLGTAGCNLGCDSCINWRVSQTGNTDEERLVPPAAVVEQACELGVRTIALSYTEPTVFFEYAEEIALRARRAGLAVVAKSNGLMTPPVLERMAGWLDAVNIDLKGWREEPHRRLVGGPLAPVLDNLRRARRLGLWLEVSTLLVPGLADAAEDLEAIAGFLAAELGADTPWHLLRFFPNYRMQDEPATPQSTLERAAEIGEKAGLRFVYSKDLHRGQRLHTRCPCCRSVAVERTGLRLSALHLEDGGCRRCGQPLPGVGLGGDLVPGGSDAQETTLQTAGQVCRPPARSHDLGRL